MSRGVMCSLRTYVAAPKVKRQIAEECHKLIMDQRGWYSIYAVKPNKDFDKEVGAQL